MLVHRFDRAAARRAALVVSCTAMAFASAGAMAGDLNPPGGAVAPTMKTLDEVEPRIPIDQSMIPLTINVRGSYYLTGNLAATTANDPHVIRIQAPDVTLDLSGYTVFGESGMSVADHAILVFSSGSIEIRNGAIDGAEFNGIDVQVGEAISIRDLRVSNCGEIGIATMTTATIERCSSRDNGVAGIDAGPGSVIASCTATGNAVTGIVCDQSVVYGCGSYFNGSNGYLVGSDSVVIASVARNHASDGFRATASSTFQGCAATDCGTGFRASAPGCVFDGCVASANTASGFDALSGAVFIGCNAVGNATGGGSDPAMECFSGDCQFISCRVEGAPSSGGIDASLNSLVSQCVVEDCGTFGISGGFGSVIENSAAYDNGEAGILAQSGCSVLWCTSSSNEGPGIHVTGMGSRIDSNVARGNLIGIDVDSSTNLIVRNFAVLNNNGNNYTITGGNNFGVINSNAQTAGPWDNFE